MSTTATKQKEYEDLAMYEGGDIARFWHYQEDTFVMEWSCGASYEFKFENIEKLLDALPGKGKIGWACIKMIGIEKTGELDSYLAFKRDRKLVVMDDGEDEVVTVRMDTLRNMLKRVKEMPTLERAPEPLDE